MFNVLGTSGQLGNTSAESLAFAGKALPERECWLPSQGLQRRPVSANEPPYGALRESLSPFIEGEGCSRLTGNQPACATAPSDKNSRQA